MIQPLIVDTDQLSAVSAQLVKAASDIPMELPTFSVSGADPLSTAIAAGAVKVEEPMAALPKIKAEATTFAENIGVAAKKYDDTDRMLAEKVRHRLSELNAAQGGTEPRHASHGGGIGRYKASPLLGKDRPTLPDDPSTTNRLIGPGADGSKSAGAGSGLPGSMLPDKTDWILGGAGATAQGITDKVAELTRSGLETGGAGASPTLKKAVGEMKNPFTFLGKEAPALGTRMGGGIGAIMSIPSIAKDVGEGKMSAAQAIAREGAGLIAGTAAGGVVGVVPVAGPVLAIPTSIVVGTAVSKLVDWSWNPLQEFGKAAADGGFKTARLGR